MDVKERLQHIGIAVYTLGFWVTFLLGVIGSAKRVDGFTSFLLFPLAIGIDFLWAAIWPIYWPGGLLLKHFTGG